LSNVINEFVKIDTRDAISVCFNRSLKDQMRSCLPDG